MSKLYQHAFALVLVLLTAGNTFAQPREWTSANGAYKVQAEAIAFSDKLVVLRKDDGSLVAVELMSLSDDDKRFVDSQDAKESARKSAEEMQTWTSRDGMKVRGRVVAYGRRNVNVSRQRGKVMIDDVPFEQMDALHQRVILKVLSKLEKKELADEKQLIEWAKGLRATTKEYPLEGVLLRLESGDEIGVPFFMFTEADLKVLQPGWDLWLEQNESEELQQQESFLLRAQALEYQRNKAANRQIELLKLELLGAATGVTNIWQVGLVPAQGRFGRPLVVMVSAPNSSAATAKALAGYPGYVIGGVRKASY